ncbi:MAG: VWA domain-containing protein, partial [Verrucomicrobiota bacterium]|nr:VWA domain-containing protein [Verrucomicrobiota bacterium]
LATDLTPNRLTRAKLAAQDLISLLPGDRVGLIAFAGGAFLQAPLTVDYSAVTDSLNQLDTNIIPRGGTNIGEAIKIADTAFGKGESENRCLIIFTDGEELDADALAAAKGLKTPFRIFTVGVGTSEGAIIPVPDERGGTTFVKDEKGEFVKSRIDEARLQKLAESTGGFYVRLQNGPAEMKQILTIGMGQLADRDISATQSRKPIERYQWPLGAAIVSLFFSVLINERKRAARVAMSRRLATSAAVLFACSTVARGALNPGVDFYSNKKYDESYKSFADQLAKRPGSPELNFDLGTAAYQLGKDDEALQAFGKATLTPEPKLRIDSEMNFGNTLYRRGEKVVEKDEQKTLADWHGAIAHYDEGLAVDPNNATLKGLKAFVQSKIDELEKEHPTPPPQKQPSPPPKKDDKKNDQKDQSKGKDQEKKNDQKNQDQQKNDQQQGGGDKDQQQQAKNQDQQKPNEKKPEDQNPSNENKDQQQPGQAQAGESPGPVPTPEDKKLEGELRAQGSPSPSEEKSGEEKAAAAEAGDGKMSEAQAANLLESLKGDDAQVSLEAHERKPPPPVLRDW